MNRSRVLWTPSGARFGNLLYFFLRAYRAQQSGSPYFVLATDNSAELTRVWPRLAALTIMERSVGFLSESEHVNRFYFQRFGTDFTGSELSSFVSDRLLSSSIFRGVLADANSGYPDTSLVVNVRRGDYYSKPRNRAIYGFNIPSFVDEAVSSLAGSGCPLEQIHVVSDDPLWCRNALAFLSSRCSSLTFSGGDSAIRDFAVVANARWRVLANSSFSYWSAYVGDRLDDGRPSVTVAPMLFDRSVNDGRAWQLDPNWLVITGIPGGWDL